MLRLKELFYKYHEIILYIVFGVCTTLVNIFSYFICAHILYLDTIISTILSWIISVAFAYITNRIFVFQSFKNSIQAILKEILAFVSCRLISGIIDLFIMIIFVDMLNMNDLVVKISSNIFVIVFNYVASKYFIFSSKKS